jgi:hypothetical protein
MRAFLMIAVSSFLLAGCMHGQMGQGPHAGMGERHMRMAHGMGPLAGCPGSQEGVEASLTHMQSALNITSAQEAAWNAYAAAYRQHAASMPMRAGMGTGMGHVAAAPERMRHHEEMMARHLESMRALRASLEALYAVLTPEQRAAADALQCGGEHGH